jgi:hypothetical protein
MPPLDVVSKAFQRRLTLLQKAATPGDLDTGAALGSFVILRALCGSWFCLLKNISGRFTAETPRLSSRALSEAFPDHSVPDLPPP